MRSLEPILVLHFEMPRALTCTVRMPDLRSAARLRSAGITLTTTDLGPHFWRYVLSLGQSEQFEFGALYSDEPRATAVLHIWNSLNNLNSANIPLTPFGLALKGGNIRSTGDINELISQPSFDSFVARYVDHLMETGVLPEATGAAV